jgi:hypothetical protein
MSNEIEKAKELLNQKLTERIARCQKKIEEILQDEGCFIDVAMVISRQGILPQIIIKPNPENHNG